MNYTLAPGTRIWILFAQIFGTTFAVVGLLTYCAYLQDIRESMKSLSESGQYAATAFILSVLVYFTWKSIWSCVVICKAAMNMDDATLSANKWIISSLSLTVGGLFTPYLMTLFPNNNVVSTIRPKVYLSKVFGMFMIVGAPLAMICYSIAMKGYFTSDASSYTAAIYALGGIFTVWGIANVATFYGSTKSVDYLSNGWMQFLANATLVIVTLELIVVLFESIFELVYAIGEIFYQGRQNFFWVLLNILNVVIYALYVALVWHVTWNTMTGIWQDQVDFTTYKAAENYQKNHPVPAM
ncbi:hypothetical protein [Mesoplasma lactucae]|uniref:Uncharacterized protein n=1 Tax=Mesoplasma lactucae ATCC 49193 TaxID=81460 RepID=A0A291IRX2_9MOLU|nr:hypothetical protein [Mesoplasma lactucae]ATG97549.1 hypothetical protein CP520_02165 [Mesoplasma lactucae ATCC 49193]ATZ19992.1 hypothetical protein MLACT_v1c01700 [Mesoplasma lactucae ATCC 49193]MCL8217057.1 hypothetical protein [Mesoplasma lactucae ATCC 49193]